MNIPPVPRLVYSEYFVQVLAVYLQCTSPVHHPMPPVPVKRPVSASSPSLSVPETVWILHSQSGILARGFPLNHTWSALGTHLSASDIRSIQCPTRKHHFNVHTENDIN